MCVRPVNLHPGAARGCTVPCGQCIECRLKRSREWAVRCMHEASMYEDNVFVTLTYSDEFLPVGGSLDRAAFPLFMRRLKKELGPVRYFHAGEYGERNGRPHYHALLFGVDFGDKVPWSERSGVPVYRSGQLEAMWPFGQSEIGSVTFESAQYVAKYCVKKVTGPRAGSHYGGRQPEYATMSRRPGIGSRWMESFDGEVARSGTVVSRGVEVTAPRFYESRLSEAQLEVMKARRARKYGDRLVGWRERAAREVIAVAKLRLAEEKKACAGS